MLSRLLKCTGSWPWYVSGAAGQPLTRQDPVGNWTIQLENTDELTAPFQVGFIQDIVLTVAAATPAWP
jgi:hypothetical protein